jgi:hypothetical protein
MADKSIYGFDEPSTVVTEVDEHSAACVFSHKPEMGFSIHSLHGEVYIDYGQFVTAALIGGVLKVFCYHTTALIKGTHLRKVADGLRRHCLTHIYVGHKDASFGLYQDGIYITEASFTGPELEELHKALAGAMR